MKIQELSAALTDLFGDRLEIKAPDGWVVQDRDSQIIVLLSDDQSWLRVMISIAPQEQAKAYLQQLLQANFDNTQETRYALSNDVLWGVYQHALDSLTVKDLQRAIARLIHLKQHGLQDCFQQLAESQVRQIIWASKKQGQTLEATLQTLERFYAEGMLGGLEQPREEREAFIKSWHHQLKRLWDEVEV